MRELDNDVTDMMTGRHLRSGSTKLRRGAVLAGADGVCCGEDAS